MPNRITFITENNQTKATFDYENLPDVQTDAIKKVLGITPSGTINITENGDHDVTNYATASVEVEGGPQPTSFAPIVTGGVNKVSWSNNTQNGGFDVTITADVDGTTVTSPLTITQEMDGKTLTITASATNFESAVTTITLSYISQSPLFAAFGENAATYGFYLKTTSGSLGFYDGTTVVQSGIIFACCSQGTTPQTSNYYLNVSTTDSYLEFGKAINGVINGFVIRNSSPFSASSIQVALTLINTSTQVEYNFSLTASDTGKQIRVPNGIYTLVANVTF